MFELNVDEFFDFFKYGIFASVILCVLVFFFSPKWFTRGIFIIFGLALTLALFVGTSSINSLCQREINNDNIVTCQRTSSLLFGLISKKNIISPLDEVKLKTYSENTALYISSQGKDYLVSSGFFSNPLFVKKDIENLLAGEGEPVRHYSEGGIIRFIYTIIFIGVTSLILSVFFFLAKRLALI